MSSDADRQYEAQNDAVGDDIAAGNAVDNDYTSRVGQKQAPIPVQSDNDPVGENNPVADPDSDKALQQDEAMAIDKSNIIEGRTRGAAKQAGTYQDPGDEEGLPGPDDGTSRIATEGTQDPSVKDI